MRVLLGGLYPVVGYLLLQMLTLLAILHVGDRFSTVERKLLSISQECKTHEMPNRNTEAERKSRLPNYWGPHVYADTRSE